MAIAREPERTFVPAPEGLHQARCVDEVDLGEMTTPWGKVRQVELRWQLGLENPETGRRFEVRKRYRLSLHKKAALRHDLEIWRGRRFSAEELKGFDLEKIVGAGCQLQVQHSAPDEEIVFANVTAVLPPVPGHAMPANGYVRQRDRERASVTMPAAAEVPF